MGNLKEIGASFRLLGRDWKLLFTVNVIDNIQDKFDTNINKLAEILDFSSVNYYRNVAFIVGELINENIAILNEKNDTKEPPIDITILRMSISNANISDCVNAIVSAYSLSFLTRESDQEPTPSDGTEVLHRENVQHRKGFSLFRRRNLARNT